MTCHNGQNMLTCWCTAWVYIVKQLVWTKSRLMTVWACFQHQTEGKDKELYFQRWQYLCACVACFVWAIKWELNVIVSIHKSPTNKFQHILKQNETIRLDFVVQHLLSDKLLLLGSSLPHGSQYIAQLLSLSLSPNVSSNLGKDHRNTLLLSARSRF